MVTGVKLMKASEELSRKGIHSAFEVSQMMFESEGEA